MKKGTAHCVPSLFFFPPAQTEALFSRFRRRACPAGPLARCFLGSFSIIVGASDRRRQYSDVESFLSAGLRRVHLARTTAPGTRRFGFDLGHRCVFDRGGFWRYSLLPRPIICVGVDWPLATTAIPAVLVIAIVPLIPLLIARLFTAAFTFERTFALRLFGAAFLARIFRRVEIITVIIEIFIGTAETLLRLLFFLPGAIVGQNAEIMIRELKIIFRVHPVTDHLRVPGHILVFFKKLGRVTAGAIVDTIAAVAAAPVVAAIRTTVIVPAAITATGLPVIDQELVLAFTLPSFTENTVQSPS